MHRIVFCKEPGSENYLRSLALDLITRSESTQQALDLAAVIAYASGLRDEESLELVSWILTFSLIICVAAKP